MLRFFFLLLPCLALAQYPKAMDFSKLYQGKIDSLVVIHRMGWTRETSWPEALKKSISQREENAFHYQRGTIC